MEITATQLAMMTPRFRAVAMKMASMPLKQRKKWLREWLKTQPDGAEILERIEATDTFSPCPVGGDGARLKGFVIEVTEVD